MKKLIALLLWAIVGSAFATPVNHVVVFGDSLSDNGNLYQYMKHQMPVCPPYYEGRFSDGPVWIEYLMGMAFPQDSNAHLADYAFGGAGVMEGDVEGLLTLKGELENYFLAHNNKTEANTLYIVWVGANNYLSIPDEVDETVAAVNLGIEHALVELAEKGAKNILVLNLPDLGKTPAAYDYESTAELSNIALKHNQMLLDRIQRLKAQYPNVHWMHFDVQSALQDVMDHATEFGFTNINGTCYEAKLPQNPGPNLALKIAASIKVKSTLADPCDGYLFFDPVHPATRAHALLAERIKASLVSDGIEFK